jgi:sporulation protein YabP
VVSFDERTIIAETECGTLIIKGNSLNITNLNIPSGELTLTGSIDGVVYDNRVRQSLLSRIFK